MKSLLKKYQSDISAWGGLLAVFLASRLINLGLIPIFTDEAIYLRWSQIMAFDASLRYLPLVDGKPPLFMWLTAIIMRLLPRIDILLTGRLVSIAAGLGALIGIYFTSYLLFKSKKISYLSSIFYILAPFTLFYDRFGLADSLLAMFAVWSLGLGVLLVKTTRLDVSMILGFAVGFGLLTKTPALFSLLYLPMLLLLFNFKARDWKLKLVKTLGLFALSAAIAEMIYSVLRLFPLFNMISQKNLEFSLSFSAFFRRPFEFSANNFPNLLNWEASYLTPVVTIAVLIGIVIGLKKYLPQTIILVLTFSGLLIYMSFFNKIIYPRFLLTFTPSLLILAAVGMDGILKKSRANLSPFAENLGRESEDEGEEFSASEGFRSRRSSGEKIPQALAWGASLLYCFIALLLYFVPVYTDVKLIFDPLGAPLLQADRDQYLDGWPAGYGVKEVRAFLSEQSNNNRKVVIGTEGTFGLMPYALEIYKKDYPNVDVKPYWPLGDSVPPEIASDAQKYPTYFLIYQRPDVPPGWKLELIARYREGLSNDYLRLYKVLP